MTSSHHNNRTKVVCTIGPASSSEEMLRQLILAGMDVARLNFSHGSHEVHAETVARVRRLSEELNLPVAILQDLQGPKIRIGKMDEPYPIAKGDVVYISTTAEGRRDNVLPIQYETFAEDVREGDLILADDGKVTLNVLESNGEDLVKLEVVYGDAIGSRKGVNLPFTDISLPSLTPKDIADLEFGLKQEVDWIALSFVRTAEELRELKSRIRMQGADTRVIAKVEKPEALKNIDEIIAEADGIMVARGDLGVEIPLEGVPIWQKTIIKKCNAAAKPVIVATQMMESMIENSRPTRAEANDVANAVTDGADAVMLSGETSVGRFPVETVQAMERIITVVEEAGGIYHRNMSADKGSPTYIHDSIIVSGCHLAETVGANAVVGMTASGYTAFHLSKCRPKAHIFIFTHKRRMINVLNLLWGVRAYFYDNSESTDRTIEDTIEILRLNRRVTRGDVVVHCASMPLAQRQRTNMVKVTKVE
ncbi:MAG: pyruvate kinase [Bacteroidota bacterium]